MKILKRVLLASLFLTGGVMLLSGVSFAIDPNINTQLTDLRSDGTNGAPGFNPCRGGTRQTDGTCGGAAMAFDGTQNALLDLDNLGTATQPGNFTKAGPGAITDNMFGMVSTTNAAGTAMDITQCSKIGLNTTTSSAALASPVGFQPGLNCGDIRFDPTTQGQSLPAVTANTLVTGPAGLDMNTQFIADFCGGPSGPPTDCSDGTGSPGPNQKVAAHAGFNIVNNFNFKVIDGTDSTTSGTDNMHQVTAVSLVATNVACPTAPCIGTQSAPGAGDQVVDVNVNWTTAAVAGTGASSNDGTVGPTGLTINWTQNITDPDQSGTGGAFTQNIVGSFTYNTATAVTAQYPSGATQTLRSTGATPSGETLTFP